MSLRSLRRSGADAAPPTEPELLSRLLREGSEPLEAVLAMAEQLGRPMGLREQAACLHALKAEAGRASDLFAMAQALREPPTLTAAPVRLAEVLEAAASGWRAVRPTAVIVAFDGDRNETAIADGEALRRLFDALWRVSQTIAPRGLFEMTLAVGAAEGRVSVAGLARTSGERLGRAPETGLDLAYARALAGWMGGALRVTEEVGAALAVRFVLDLPMADGESAEGGAEDGPTPHVLIVDDNATNRLVAEAFCDMLGCSCETAVDGLEALEAVRLRAFDLILMDIKMPNMDGVEATRAIRAMSGPVALTPIVALTANADPEDVRTYKAAGMQDVIEKPIKAERLAQAVGAIAKGFSSPKVLAA